MALQQGAFLSLYDQQLRADPSPWGKVYYRVTRPKFAAMVSKMAMWPEVNRVLEIGTCRFSQQLSQLCPNWDVHSLDLGEHCRSECEAAGVQFHVGDILQPLPVPPDYFDLIIFSEVIEHLHGNPRAALRNLKSALRPGGRLLITTPNLVRLASRIKMLLGRDVLERIGPPEYWRGHVREYTLAEVVEMLRREGYELDSAEHSMHWDGVGFYMNSGPFGQDEDTGEFFFRPRFRGWKWLPGLVYSVLTNRLAAAFPGFRHALLVVARRPAN